MVDSACNCPKCTDQTHPVRRVARWDAYALAYAAKNADGAVHYYQHADRAKADGYEIEGGPESIQSLSRCPDCGGPRTDMDEHDAWCDDCWGKRCQPAEDSPERLRERRRGVGWTLGDAARASGLAVSDVSALESGHAGSPHLARYAAALSAEEARRAAKHDEPWLAPVGHVIDAALGKPERPTPRFGVGDWVRVTGGGAVHQVVSVVSDLTPTRYGVGPGGALVREDDLEPATQPDRPAPRFKVGEWVRVVSNGAVYQVGEIATPFGGMAYYFRETGGAENSWQAAALEPASPPAPEVVDVPQPVPPMVKRCDGVEACWHMDEDHAAFYLHEPDSEAVDVPNALILAMADAIRAQQGEKRWFGIDLANEPGYTVDQKVVLPEPRYKEGDWVRDIDGCTLQVKSLTWSNDSWRYVVGNGFVAHPEIALAPALNPLLRETARKAIAWLRATRRDDAGCVTSGIDIDTAAPGHKELPAYKDWFYASSTDEFDDRWAAQLEQLLGDA